ncbi:MAG: adenylyltransferase/cytidyltransferase family protein [Neisseria sp.]|uniref:adenylyltransferase/cytidyltransferase family protein n=1 Tax=Neisseria sp. TaxID=192066 RepID=UPI0026DDA33A|nr:adenylyltransferase/cytidyltransferase family protein [Neisseria sp.]MDO4640912.1 adenylyltransferase/cytidyltransferase family protein [Neisseria sp.]
MKNWPLPDFEQKICPPEMLVGRLAQLPRPLVFTNGCFDILHRGHVTYLAQARATGAALILALNTDASVRRQDKGDDRPVNTLENRAAVAAALACVDLVTWFDSNTPAELIDMVRPDILIKGGDWPVEKIVGAQETLARGGKVYSIPFLHATSTTKTLEKIRSTQKEPRS